MLDLEFIKLLDRRQKDGGPEVFLLQIGLLYDNPFVTGIFESFDLAKKYLDKYDLKDYEVLTDRKDNWYVQSESHWANIQSQKVIKK